MDTNTINKIDCLLLTTTKLLTQAHEELLLDHVSIARLHIEAAIALLTVIADKTMQ